MTTIINAVSLISSLYSSALLKKNTQVHKHAHTHTDQHTYRPTHLNTDPPTDTHTYSHTQTKMHPPKHTHSNTDPPTQTHSRNTHWRTHTDTQSISSSRVCKMILTSPLAVTLSVILLRAVCRLRTFKSSADGETLNDAEIRFSAGTHSLKCPYLSYPPIVCTQFYSVIRWVLIII